MSDTYVPGFSHALQRYATGGAVNPFPTANTSNVPPDVDLSAWTRSAFAKPTYSDATQQYLNSVLAYAQSMKPQYGSYYADIPLARQIATPVANIPMYASEAELQQYLTRPPEQNVAYTFNLPSNGRSGKTGDVTVRYDTPIMLVDNRTGQVVASGTGFDAANQAIAKARDFTSTLRGKSNWSIYTGPPGATDPSQFVRVARDDPAKGVLGTIANLVLPTIGAIVGGPLGAAAGRAISGIAQGDSLGGILKNSAITGGLSAIGGKVLGGSSGTGGTPPGFGGAASGTGSGLLSNLAAAAPGEIVVEGARSKLPAILGGLGAAGAAAAAAGAFGGGSSATGSAAGTPTATPAEPYTGLEVIANRGALTPAQIAAAAGVGGLGAGAAASGAGGSGSGAQASSGTQQQPTPQPTTQQPVNPNDIVVNANVPPKLDLGTIGSITGAAGLGGLLTSPVTLPSTPAPQLPPAEKKGILDQIGELSTLDKIRLAGLGLGTIGDLFSGGGGSASPGTIPGGLNGGLSPVFSKTLPTANLPAATPRTAQDLDYYRYGYGPQQSFFSNAPQGAANTSQAYTGYAEGGEVGEGAHAVSPFAVGGPGDGREDKIPAMLSDGEYVMDAETVALLGNGSSKAGAKMLDKFRVNVRKQKGRKLAKGAFSDDAKAPEHYLKGRK